MSEKFEEITTPVGVITNEELALGNKFFKVVERTIAMPDGQERQQLVWDRRGKDFVVVLAITDGKQIVMVNEPKYGQMGRFLGLPTGAVKHSENFPTAALRELKEETGYQAGSVEGLGALVAYVDFPDKVAGGNHYMYRAYGIEKIEEPEEGASVVLVDVDGLPEILRKGKGPENENMSAMNLAILAQAYFNLAGE